jgi:hypothetical protein
MSMKIFRKLFLISNFHWRTKWLPGVLFLLVYEGIHRGKGRIYIRAKHKNPTHHFILTPINLSRGKVLVFLLLWLRDSDSTPINKPVSKHSEHDLWVTEFPAWSQSKPFQCKIRFRGSDLHSFLHHFFSF